MEPSVLLYNVPPEKVERLRALCRSLSIRMIIVPERRHGCTIAQTLRQQLPDRAAARPFHEEMLVMALPDLLMDFFLQGLRQTGSDIALKAAITPTNISWRADALFQELQREHRAMHRR